MPVKNIMRAVLMQCLVRICSFLNIWQALMLIMMIFLLVLLLVLMMTMLVVIWWCSSSVA